MKFNLSTLEYEFQVSGQSKGLMALRGYETESPDSHFFRQSFHFLDGESNLNILFHMLQGKRREGNIVKLKTNILTFDGLRIETECRCCYFTNRDETYPFCHE